MDRIKDSGSLDRGSTPFGRTIFLWSTGSVKKDKDQLDVYMNHAFSEAEKARLEQENYILALHYKANNKKL